MKKSRWLWAIALFGGTLSACSGRASEPETPVPPADPRTQAPWSARHLAAASVPSAYITTWEQAENRETCALVGFAESEATADATARPATFAGGWGVAYDRPGQRSAFGVAGTGVSAAEPTYHEWPMQRRWVDGSSAGYGPEGGTGPNQLAYLEIRGQRCLYNVWSRLGVEHLEQLLESLRYIETN